MNGSKKSVCALVLTSALAIFLIFPGRFPQAQTADPWPSAQEAARRTRDESQLQALKTRLERSLDQNPNDAQTHYRLAEVQGYLADVYEARKEKKSARTAVDQGIEATLRSLQFNEKSADAHSLLADLYGRKISLGNAMFAGPRYGPKVDEENKRAMALDDKNPRVWASLRPPIPDDPETVRWRPPQGRRKLPEVGLPRSLARRNLGLASKSLRQARRQTQGPGCHATRAAAQPRKSVCEERGGGVAGVKSDEHTAAVLPGCRGLAARCIVVVAFDTIVQRKYRCP